MQQRRALLIIAAAQNSQSVSKELELIYTSYNGKQLLALMITIVLSLIALILDSMVPLNLAISQPPVLNKEKSKVDGLAFLGLSLTRKSDRGHPDSITHQTAFDLNNIIDRDYEYIESTNDDGWLVGGGEPGPPQSYKLAAKDSAHVEIMRIGTYRADWGGIDQKEIIE